MPVRPPLPFASPALSTRPGLAAAARVPAERRRSRYGASVAAGSESRASPAGRSTGLAAADAQRAAGVEVLDRARRRAAGTASRAPSPASTQASCRAPLRGTRRRAGRRRGSRRSRPRGAAGRSRRPRTRRAGSRAGTCVPRTRLRQPRPCRRARRRPAASRSAAPGSGGGRRAPGRACSVLTVVSRGVVQSSHAVRPSSHEPIHGCGVPSNALEARKPGPALEAPRGVEVAAHAGQRVERGVGRVRRGAWPSRRASTCAPRAARTRAPGRSRRRARSRTSASDEEPRRGSRRNGSSPVVRWNR